MSYSLLPHINAVLNATSGVLLISGFFFIYKRNIRAHYSCMVAAVIASSGFLVSYLIYHYHVGSIRFTGHGVARTFYFTILTSHTILAAVIVPLVSITLVRALRCDFKNHMRIARWTFPIWLYVSVTGVIVYLMLYRIYPHW